MKTYKVISNNHMVNHEEFTADSVDVTDNCAIFKRDMKAVAIIPLTCTVVEVVKNTQ